MTDVKSIQDLIRVDGIKSTPTGAATAAQYLTCYDSDRMFNGTDADGKQLYHLAAQQMAVFIPRRGVYTNGAVKFGQFRQTGGPLAQNAMEVLQWFGLIAGSMGNHAAQHTHASNMPRCIATITVVPMKGSIKSKDTTVLANPEASDEAKARADSLAGRFGLLDNMRMDVGGEDSKGEAEDAAKEEEDEFRTQAERVRQLLDAVDYRQSPEWREVVQRCEPRPGEECGFLVTVSRAKDPGSEDMDLWMEDPDKTMPRIIEKKIAERKTERDPEHIVAHQLLIQQADKMKNIKSCPKREYKVVKTTAPVLRYHQMVLDDYVAMAKSYRCSRFDANKAVTLPIQHQDNPVNPYRLFSLQEAVLRMEAAGADEQFCDINNWSGTSYYDPKRLRFPFHGAFTYRVRACELAPNSLCEHFFPNVPRPTLHLTKSAVDEVARKFLPIERQARHIPAFEEALGLLSEQCEKIDDADEAEAAQGQMIGILDEIKAAEESAMESARERAREEMMARGLTGDTENTLESLAVRVKAAMKEAKQTCGSDFLAWSKARRALQLKAMKEFLAIKHPEGDMDESAIACAKWMADFLEARKTLRMPLPKETSNLSYGGDLLHYMMCMPEADGMYVLHVVSLLARLIPIDVWFPRKLGFNMLLLSAHGKGKTRICELLAESMISGTFKRVQRESEKANDIESNFTLHHKVFIKEEISPGSLGIAQHGAGPDVSAARSTGGAKESAMTDKSSNDRAEMTNQTKRFTRLVQNVVTGRFEPMVVEVPFRHAYLAANNLNKQDIPKNVASRWLCLTCPEKGREECTMIQRLSSRLPDELKAPADVYQLRCRRDQALASYIGQMVTCGIIAEVETSATDGMILQIMDFARKRGLPEADEIRKMELFKIVAQILAYKRAVAIFFDSEDSPIQKCKDWQWRYVIDYRFEDYYIVTKGDVVCALGLMCEQWEDGIAHNALKALQQVYNMGKEVISQQEINRRQAEAKKAAKARERGKSLKPKAIQAPSAWASEQAPIQIPPDGHYVSGDNGFQEQRRYYAEEAAKKNKGKRKGDEMQQSTLESMGDYIERSIDQAQFNQSEIQKLSYVRDAIYNKMEEKPGQETLLSWLNAMTRTPMPRITQPGSTTPAILVRGCTLHVARTLLSGNSRNRLLDAVTEVLNRPVKTSATYIFGQPDRKHPHIFQTIPVGNVESARQKRLGENKGDSKEREDKSVENIAAGMQFMQLDNPYFVDERLLATIHRFSSGEESAELEGKSRISDWTDSRVPFRRVDCDLEAYSVAKRLYDVARSDEQLTEGGYFATWQEAEEALVPETSDDRIIQRRRLDKLNRYPDYLLETLTNGRETARLAAQNTSNPEYSLHHHALSFKLRRTPSDPTRAAELKKTSKDKAHVEMKKLALAKQQSMRTFLDIELSRHATPSPSPSPSPRSSSSNRESKETKTVPQAPRPSSSERKSTEVKSPYDTSLYEAHMRHCDDMDEELEREMSGRSGKDEKKRNRDLFGDDGDDDENSVVVFGNQRLDLPQAKRRRIDDWASLSQSLCGTPGAEEDDNEAVEVPHHQIEDNGDGGEPLDSESLEDEEGEEDEAAQEVLDEDSRYADSDPPASTSEEDKGEEEEEDGDGDTSMTETAAPSPLPARREVPVKDNALLSLFGMR